jgi:hypothetical protein
MKPFRNLSTQFHVTHEKVGRGRHLLTLSNMDSSNLAWVSFEHHNDPEYDIPSRIEIEYLQSHQEGSGHAKALMQHLYDRYPKSHIDWGLTVHPAATHLANHFEDKYYKRTAYEQDDGEEDY